MFNLHNISEYVLFAIIVIFIHGCLVLIVFTTLRFFLGLFAINFIKELLFVLIYLGVVQNSGVSPL